MTYDRYREDREQSARELARLLDAVATVSDLELVEAMRLSFERLKLVVEPGARVASA